jgi:PAS domain S-box-containing protein
VATVVHQVLAPEGRTRWPEWKDHAYFDDEGRIIRYQSIGRDITDRKQAEDLLRQSEELNRRIVEAIPGGIVHVGREGQILSANTEARRILGINSDQVARATILDLEPWTVYENGVTCPREEFPAALCRATAERQEPVTLGTLRPSGEISWAIYTAVPVLAPETGELDGAILTFLNITGRRLAEDALRNSAANHRAMVRAVPDPMFRVSKDGLFIDFIPADGFELFTGPEKFLGRSLEQVLPQHIGTRARKAISDALQTNDVRSFEYEAELKGRFRHFEARVVPDRSESVLILVRDISKRRAAELERERLLLELEEKDREPERFARTVSHDLKSPLITIRGFLEVLEDDRASVSPRAGEALDRINSAARTMLQLLDELFELARVGGLVNPSETFAFGELARAAVDHVSGRIVKRGVRVDIKPDLPYVFGDRIRILQVVQNVIENAVKFMGTQRQPRIEVGAEDRHTDVLCYVRDNGSGIDPRDLDRMFGVFDRLERDIEGTGLGLAIVKRIIEAHEGRVWADSESLGRGTTLYFSLPKEGMTEARLSSNSAA